MLNNQDMAALFGLPPERAIAYLKNKGYNITWDWEDMWQDAHAKAFTVAKLTRMDIL
ncbi:phage head morphogenesis protein, partial [Salmonella enterica]|nr:phage head morphogenesis protein [Salmonella enterica]